MSNRRSPSWGAWIETSFPPTSPKTGHCRSPSWGAWIETARKASLRLAWSRRSPSWGAWIETWCRCFSWCRAPCRSPSWGAWIETGKDDGVADVAGRRSPSWGAWIETFRHGLCRSFQIVAPPRGERGLKLAETHGLRLRLESLPLVGSVD